jgi:excisionase family DNA binding protein
MEKLLNIAQLAERLEVEKSWIYTMTRRKKIPHRKLGKYVRFDAAEIQNWIDGKRRGPAA